MSDEQPPPGGQPVGQLSPDGRWRWDGHNWVSAQQPPVPPYQQPQQPQQYGAPPYGNAPYGGQPPVAQQYGGYPPGMVSPQKKGLPTWAKVLLIVLSLVVALMVLLTVVGLMVDKSYADWSCEDVAAEAVRISSDQDEALVLTEVTDLKVVEDNRDDFTPPSSGRGVVLSCEGTGTWDELDDTTPVIVELSAGEDEEEWVRYEMTE